jgi:dihydrofolate reductase
MEELYSRAGLADELQLFLVPVVVGGGKRALPDGVRSDLELPDTRRFAGSAVYFRYRPKSAPGVKQPTLA